MTSSINDNCDDAVPGFDCPANADLNDRRTGNDARVIYRGDP
jgi:hypothetical protein